MDVNWPACYSNPAFRRVYMQLQSRVSTKTMSRPIDTARLTRVLVSMATAEYISPLRLRNKTSRAILFDYVDSQLICQARYAVIQIDRT